MCVSNLCAACSLACRCSEDVLRSKDGNVHSVLDPGRYCNIDVQGRSLYSVFLYALGSCSDLVVNDRKVVP